MEGEQSYDDGTSSQGTGIASKTSTSISEVAGQRLYLNAKETKKKIEEAREKAKIHKPVLNLATRGRTSRESSPCRNETPRYIQLYEHAKNKQVQETVSTQEPVILNLSKNNEGCERLYSLSKSMQHKGRERREEIEKSKLKPPLPESHFRKIPASQATKLYDRGMKHLISLEKKRMDAAFSMSQEYVSPLVPQSKEEAEVAVE
mmetsp:Transcript_3570/g.4723  ORF Transcript_3570/g.4723 Transcript_3570/m.4723 type:complete len:204 (-) Transcript_3570:262-873(-)